jgi:putative Holliday junction resolvase
MSDSFPSAGRIAGIDFGTVRIGVALTDAERRLASPHGSHTRGTEQQDAEYFQRLTREEEIVGFVVGLPVHMSGSESKLSNAARQFGTWLENVTARPVTYHDERFTSVEAENLLRSASPSKKKREKRLDKVAAQVMLASFLEKSEIDSAPKSITDAEPHLVPKNEHVRHL